jgi:phospholipase/lecithinase/hemolysin
MQLGVQYFDTAAVLADITANPAAYGLTNVTDPCFDSEADVPGPACTDPEHYLFFDSFHPSAAAHHIVGDAFFAATVPAPAELPLVGAALLLVLAIRKGARRAHAARLAR